MTTLNLISTQDRNHTLFRTITLAKIAPNETWGIGHV